MSDYKNRQNIQKQTNKQSTSVSISSESLNNRKRWDPREKDNKFGESHNYQRFSLVRTTQGDNTQMESNLY